MAEYDIKIDEYVATAMTGAEVYGTTGAECEERLREANRIWIEHCQKCQEDRDEQPSPRNPARPRRRDSTPKEEKMYPVMEEIKRVCERNCRDYEALALMEGKTIAEIEADTTAPDQSKYDSNKLSDNIGAEFDGGNVILYDVRACSVKRIIVITSGEMEALIALYEDGCCPVCLKEIPLHDIICDECLENARNMRRLAR